MNSLSPVQRHVLNSLSAGFLPLTRLGRSDYVLPVVVMLLRRLDGKLSGSSFIVKLFQVVAYRYYLGLWPEHSEDVVDVDGYGFQTSLRWSQGDVSFTLSRERRGNGYYWYLQKNVNGQRFRRYVGKNLEESKLLALYGEYRRGLVN